jgi:glycosyltransferase involved in cell wall biosynthesis
MTADTVTRPAQSRDEQIAAAQLQRDRGRLAAAQAEIVALRYRIDELERSPSRRLFGPARRTARLVARAIRVAKRLAKIAPAAPNASPPAGPVSRGLVLVIDYHWPEPDRDSGSVDIFNLMQALKALGFEPILAAAEQHDGPQPARDRLIAQGIRCLLPSDAPSVAHYVVRHGAAIDLCVLCRVYCGAAFLEMVQIHARKARLVFNSIDLNFVREERRAQLTGDAKLLAMIGQLREREEHVIRSCDATLVVSEAEYALLAETMPASLVAQMPLARPIHPPVTPFAQRRGIGFVGSFAHGPNADAMRMFLAEIWPLVRRGLPDCTLSIVGAGAPADLVDAADPSVQILGHVPDLGPWFESLRLTVAPLRFGAGAKGKVASSLSAGVPCIATPMAAEGMALGEAGGVLIESDPAAFAAAVIRAYGDAALWTRLSAGAIRYAETSLSLSAWQGLLDTTLRRIGL